MNPPENIRRKARGQPAVTASPKWSINTQKAATARRPVRAGSLVRGTAITCEHRRIAALMLVTGAGFHVYPHADAWRFSAAPCGHYLDAAGLGGTGADFMPVLAKAARRDASLFAPMSYKATLPGRSIRTSVG